MKAQSAPPPPTVIVTTVGRSTVPVVEDFTARTIGNRSIDIKARVEGILDQVRFQPGALVHQGDALFVIEPDQYKAALLSAQAGMLKAHADFARARAQLSIDRAKADLSSTAADLAKAQLDVRRLTPLAQQQAVPQQDLDNAMAAAKVAQARYDASAAAVKDATLDSQTQLMQAQAAVDAAQAQVKQADLNLGYTTIHAPVTGLMGLLKVDQGNLVGHGDATTLATLIAVDPMRVDFAISELDYLSLMNNKYATASNNLRLVLADNSVYPQVGHPTALNNQLDSADRDGDDPGGVPQSGGVFAKSRTVRARSRNGRSRQERDSRQSRSEETIVRRAPRHEDGARIVGAKDKQSRRPYRFGSALRLRG